MYWKRSFTIHFLNSTGGPNNTTVTMSQDLLRAAFTSGQERFELANIMSCRADAGYFGLCGADTRREPADRRKGRFVTAITQEVIARRRPEGLGLNSMHA